MNTPDLPRLIAIAGPTASGKSALAIALAERFDGTIVNFDSAQVYADLSVLTARPSATDEARVPHLLYGHVDGAQDWSAARWAAEAATAVAAVTAAGRLPILVGGTGLYLRTLVDGIAPVPPIDPAIRAEVRATPLAEAQAMLARLDPAGAARLHANDTQRTLRALEVVRSTGRPLIDWQAARQGGIGGQLRMEAVVLDPPRDLLDRRIADRFDAMLDAARAETLALAGRGDIAADAPIRRAIGVREATAYHRGTTSRDDALASGILATRRYAKRQGTWFRHQLPAAHRFAAADEALAALSTS